MLQNALKIDWNRSIGSIWNLNTETGLQSFPKMKFEWKYYALAEKIL